MAEKLNLAPPVAEVLNRTCSDFAREVRNLASRTELGALVDGAGGFRSAAEMNAVYTSCTTNCMPLLMEDFASQADAMGTLFAIAGGLISEQDEHAAEALRAASSPPPEVTGPNLGTAALGGVSAFSGDQLPGFFRVDGEDASGMSLESLQAAANALDPGAASSVADQFRNASTTLENAATALRDSIDRELGTSWQGEFADAALANVGAFFQSAVAAAGDLATVADKATGLSEGYEYTRSQIGTQAMASASGGDATDAARDAALEDAKRIVHTEYNPRIEEANLAGMNFTTAHRIGSGVTAGGQVVSPTELWNPDPGTFSPAGGATTYGAGTGVDAATRSAAVNESGPGPATASSAGGGTGQGASRGPGAATAGAAPAGTAVSAAVPGGRSSLMTTGAPQSATATRPGGATGTGGGGQSTARAGTPGGGFGQSSGSGAARGFGGAGSLSGARGSGGIGGTTATAGRGGLGPGGAFGAGASSGSPSGLLGGAGPGLAAGTSGTPGGAGGGAGTSGAAGSGGSPRGAMMGAIPMGAGAGRGEEKTHQMAEYLVHLAHKEELLRGGPRQVNGVLRGRR